MSIDLNQELNPINPEDPKYAQMLANLQGNILKSHGRDFAAHLFLNFTGKPTEVGKWIADFTNRFVTSAYRQIQETREYRLNRISGRAFGAIYFSASLPSAKENEGEHKRAGALVIGRYENGVPVLLSKTEDAVALIDVNNFHYGSDETGSKCPFQTHIRKTNPRGDTGFDGNKVNEGERRRRITRRGITYGERRLGPDGKPTLDDRPDKDVGLLFMCFQSSIPDQFGFIQAQWVNNSTFAEEGTGLDPVIGQKVHPSNTGQQRWPTTWGGAERRQFDFGDFVTLKGGEYFFAASIPFLRSLNGELTAVTADQVEFVSEETVADPARHR